MFVQRSRQPPPLAVIRIPDGQVACPELRVGASGRVTWKPDAQAEEARSGLTRRHQKQFLEEPTFEALMDHPRPPTTRRKCTLRFVSLTAGLTAVILAPRPHSTLAGSSLVTGLSLDTESGHTVHLEIGVGCEGVVYDG